MEARALYVFKSVACSNTVYYENLDHAKFFLELAQQHLKGYIVIHEYMLCKDGWLFLGRLKSEKQIQAAYAKKRKKYNKLPKTLPVWKIVSEQMRLFIGGYVTRYNGSTGREGSLVKRPYERYLFETKESALRMINRVRRRLVGLQQGKKMYRAKKGHYRIPKKLGKGGIYLSSRRSKRKNGGGRDVLDCSVFQLLSSKVLTKVIEKCVKYTKSAHKLKIPDI